MALNFQIALVNVWWNDDYKDVRRFSSESERASYFNLENIFLNSPLVNLDIKNLLAPRIVFKESNKQLFEVLNSNYLIVKDNRASSNQKYYFYFINDIRQDSGDQYIADCKLDVWQTFQFIVNVGKGLVERAHLDRFTDDENNLGFNWLGDSPLLIEEKQTNENDKILQVRKRLEIPFTIDERSVGQWCAENIDGWLYVFVEGDKTYKALNFGATEIPADPSTGTDVSLASVSLNKVSFPYCIICCPLYKQGSNQKIIIKDLNGKIIYLESGFNLFRYFNNGYSFIYSQKILPVNPLYKFLVNNNDELNFAVSSDKAIFENNNLVIKTTSILNEARGYFSATDRRLDLMAANVKSGQDYHANLILGLNASNSDITKILKQFLTIIDNFSINNQPFEYKTKNDIKNAFNNNYERSLSYNPKLYGSSYNQIRLNIANQGATSFSHAQLAIYPNSQGIQKNLFVARSSLVPEVETLGLSPYESYYLESEVSKDYLSIFGTVLTADFSIAFKNNVYEQFLANNKNFWLQNKVNWQRDIFKLFTGSLFSGDYTTKAAGKLLTGGTDIALEMFETKYRVNNMQNAPENYSSGSGSVSFALSHTEEIAYYLDIYISPIIVLDRDFDYMYLYGYKYGKIDEFTNVNNIRAYFNFVQGNFESISGNLSDEARRIIYNSLFVGVRFWNVDRPDFNFNLENFENRLLGD